MITGVHTIGYDGSVFLAPYVYYVPFTTAKHGRFLRFRTKTSGSFSNSSLWSVFDSKAAFGPNFVNYFSGSVAERLIVFPPQSFGLFLQYDSQLEFTSNSSWKYFNASELFNVTQFGSSCYDSQSKYMYFVALITLTTSTLANSVIRLDTSLPFTSNSSWILFNLTSLSPSFVGLAGAMCVSNAVLFIPYRTLSSGVATHVRYNTSGNLSDPNSYTSVDSSILLDYSAPPGFIGACQIGDLIFYPPLGVFGTGEAIILRYNSSKPLAEIQSWSMFDAQTITNDTGYYGCVSDGSRFVYFVPLFSSSLFKLSGTVLRYDNSLSFENSAAWETYNASSTNGLAPCVGYKGGSFDGKYIYFAPALLNIFSDLPHANMLRYDTGLSYPTPPPPPPTTPAPTPLARYNDPNYWEAFNASYVTGTQTIGFNGVIFVSPYLYYYPAVYSPSQNSSSSKFLRFDTRSRSFSNESAWTMFSAVENLGRNSSYFEAVVSNSIIIFIPQTYGIFVRYNTSRNFLSASSWSVFDVAVNFNVTYATGGCVNSRYIYFSTIYSSLLGFSGKFLRLDTTTEFEFLSSWRMFDLTTINTNLTGYAGIVCLSDSALLVPHQSGGLTFQNRHVRYSFSGDFLSPSSYTWNDSSILLNTDPIGYVGACKVGDIVIYPPLSSSLSTMDSRVLRYDSTKPLSDASAFSIFDVSVVGGIGAGGFFGCVTDERYVYFTPYAINSTVLGGKTVRYDSTMSFTNINAWIAYNVNGTDGLLEVGMKGGAFDGNYIYFAPSLEKVEGYYYYHANMLRYLAVDFPASPTPVPTPTTTQQSTTNSINAIVSSENSSSTIMIIGIVIGVLLLLICVIIVIIFIVLRKGRKEKQSSQNNQLDVDLQTKSQTQSQQQPENNSTTSGITTDKSQYAHISDIKASQQSGGSSQNHYQMPLHNKTSNSNTYIIGASVAVSNNESQYVSPTTILENSATKIEARELFKKFAIPYSDLILDKEIGKGNFGSVFLAHSRSQPNQTIACKQIAGQPTSDSYASTVSDALKQETKSFKDFIAEAKVLQSIPPSPYVVRFLGLCSEPFCILTEFIDGGSLLEYLEDRNNQFTVRLALGFLKQICKGIAHLHRNGIIHRDLAARNVLLRTKIDEESGVRQCVLVDMGLARLFETNEDYLKTMSQIPLKWTAPEALRDKKFSEKSDIYSFGILAIECFTRDKPFPEMSPLECAMAISSGRFVPTLSSICSNEIAAVLDPCLALEPNQRPTAYQLIESFNYL